MTKKLAILPIILLGASILSFNNKEGALMSNAGKLLPQYQSEGFDEDNIDLTFFAFSDTHIGYGNDDVLLHNALKCVKENYDIDCTAVCGDITQDGKEDNVKKFREIYDTYYDISETPMALAYGNHDTSWSGCMNTTGFYEALGEDFFAGDVSDVTSAKAGNRHLLVNGYHFLCVQMQTYGVGTNPISDATKSWLEGELNAITQENPNQFVFVLSHSPAKNTIVGSKDEDLSGEWGSSQMLRTVFENYPQVVHLSGHTHYFNQDDRFISSAGGFLSVGVPSTCDITYNSIGDESWTDGDLGSIPSNSRSYSYGQIFQVDKDGNIKITRIDFKNNDIIKRPIVIPHIDANNTHLTVMSDAYRTEHNEKPYYDGEDQIVAYYLAEKDVEIRYPSFKDDDAVFYYTILIKNQFGMQLKKVNQYSPFITYPNPDNIPSTLTYRLKNLLLSGTFSISVTAVDQWGAESEPVVTEITRNISQDKAKAADLVLQIKDLVDLGEVSEDMYDQIKAIRQAYDSYDFLIQQYVTNYPSFVKLESDFYNSLYLNGDVSTFELGIENVYSNAPVPSRGRFQEGDYGGVSFIWDSATTNNSIGINRGYFLDTLHISFTNTNFNSDEMRLGFILDNDIQVNYTLGENLMLVVDFYDGIIYMQSGDLLNQIGSTSLMKFSSINHTPWEMKFNKVNDGYEVSFITISGKYSCLIANDYFSGLTSYKNPDNTFVAITPVGSHISASIDVLSIHHRNCAASPLEQAKESALSELASYYEGINLTKYTDESKTVLANLYSQAQANVNSALTVSAVNDVVNSFKVDVSKVPTIQNDEPEKDDDDEKPTKGGCGGSIIASSLLLTGASVLGATLVSKKKKEDK